MNKIEIKNKIEELEKELNNLKEELKKEKRRKPTYDEIYWYVDCDNMTNYNH